MRTSRFRRTAAGLAVVAAVGVLAACSSSSDGGGSGESSGGGDSTPLRLGYFANITHATALVGLSEGIIQDKLGSTPLETEVFNAGGAAAEALLAGAIDATFIGPNPAINAFVESNGEAIRIISGATSGGAQLVTSPDITDVSQLKGKTLNTPQLGNTQDVALKFWLKENGLEVPKTGTGDVLVENTENAQTLDLFKAGTSNGGWLPEPWSSRLVLEGGGKVLVNEADLWPKGQFVTTHLIVRTEYLEQHPDVVKELLEGVIAADTWIKDNPTKAPDVANAKIEEDTQKAIPADVLARAWRNIEITLDPIAASLKGSAEHAFAVGLTDENPDLKGIYDLGPLNELLKADGQTEVSDGGLGQG